MVGLGWPSLAILSRISGGGGRCCGFSCAGSIGGGPS